MISEDLPHPLLLIFLFEIKFWCYLLYLCVSKKGFHVVSNSFYILLGINVSKKSLSIGSHCLV